LDGSGSGKSASYVIPNAYQLLGSYVFTDPKGELYDKTAGFLQQNGYEIKVLNLVNPANSDGYNPLMHIASELDVDVIVNTIPAEIVAAEKLLSIRKECYILELASMNVLDAEEAEKLELKYDIALGLPGKFTPESAGKSLAGAIIRSLQ